MADSNVAHISHRIDELRALVSQIDPGQLAERTASQFFSNGAKGGSFQLALWERQVTLSYPELIAREVASQGALPVSNQALLLFYFYTADGAPLARQWVSFSELPDGRFYNQAYQGYSGGELVRAFGEGLEAFQAAALAQGGELLPSSISGMAGASAYRFWALPCVPLLAVAWPGDEDLASTYQILFDAAVPHYLPSDVCALLGGTLARRLAALKPGKPASGDRE